MLTIGTPILIRPRRQGFSMVELLVSLTVVGILVSLLLFGIFSARESSRRIQCANNLKQFGLASQSYSNVFAGFPAIGRRDIDFWNAHSTHYVDLMPYMDLQAFETIARDGGQDSSVPARLLAMGVPSFFCCPSDFNHRSGASYPVSTGSSDSAYLDKSLLDIPAVAEKFQTLIGPSGTEKIESLSHIRDGLSNTVLYAEHRIGGSELWDWTPNGIPQLHRRVVPNSINFISFTLHPNRVGNLCTELWAKPSDVWAKDTGANYLAKRGNHYNHIFPPNHHVDDCTIGGSFEAGALTARSYHNGGIMTAWCDGRTVLISNTIDLPVWRAIGTRAGGTTEPAFSAE